MKLLTPVRMQKCTSEVKHDKCSSEAFVKIERRILLLFLVLQMCTTLQTFLQAISVALCGYSLYDEMIPLILASERWKWCCLAVFFLRASFAQCSFHSVGSKPHDAPMGYFISSPSLPHHLLSLPSSPGPLRTPVCWLPDEPISHVMQPSFCTGLAQTDRARISLSTSPEGS